MAPRLLGWLIFLAIIGAPVAYLYLYEAPIEVTVTQVATGRVEETISAIASGAVMPVRDAMIASPVIGTVLAIPFNEGATVAEGDLLIEVDHTELDAQVRLAEANLDAGHSNLRQAQQAAEIYADIAETQVRLAQAQLDAAQKDFDRIKAITERGGVSTSDMDKVRLQFRVAQEQLAQAEANRRENAVRQEQIETAKANIAQLDAAREAAEASRDRAFIRAPFAGIVADLRIDVGEAVALGMPLVQLIDATSFYVEAPFDEANSADIAVGQTARINLDAYRGVDFAGKITYIAPVVSLNPDRSRTRNVKIHVVEGEEKFVAGMSADVTILVNARDDVAYVPTETLVREQWAFVVEGGRAIEREVQLGLGNWERTEIVGGLKPGETLISSVSVKGLDNGAKVNVVDSLAE